MLLFCHLKLIIGQQHNHAFRVAAGAAAAAAAAAAAVAAAAGPIY